MLFGAISEKFTSELVVCSAGVGSQEHVENVAKCGIVERMNNENGQRNWLFMQDGAPAHSAASSMRQPEQVLVFLGGWPAPSCDLNPIEMVWSLIKRRLQAGDHRDLPLHERIVRLWSKIPQETITRLVPSRKRG